MNWPLTGERPTPDVDPPTVRITRLPRPDPAARPNRDLVVRQMQRRPIRRDLAVKLMSRYATAPAGLVAVGQAPMTRRARWAIRASEWLLGVPAGATRAALREPVGRTS